ncbi:hypothetical protein BKI52_28810 [marine bacterium AO1-C]|nr:hypothetical protein BKI52_28810 [marine bacterium AO1-C]
MKNKVSQVLLVDDNQQSLRTLLNFLQKKSNLYQPLTAPNGKVAAQIVQKVTPDLVITDWDMPLMDGLSLIRHLRKQPNTRSVPVIIVTGINTTPENLQEAFEAGANDYLAKPFNSVELYARAKAAIAMHQALRTIQAQSEMIKDQKNRELSTKTMVIAQKNQLLDDIRKDIQAVTQQAGDGLKKDLISIERKIKNSQSLNDEWDTFKLHFEQVHPRFFEVLQHNFKNLSQIDLRHCAYIKIGLSNKEISRILSISSESVVKQHYRIKKKMGFATNKTLGEVVQALQF